MNPEEWDVLREGWAFEAKAAQGPDGKGAVPASFWETYSAFANTEGGVIVLGAVERTDGTLEARGIEDIDKVERDLWDLLQNPQKVSANVLTRSNVTREEFSGRVVLVIRVPKASRAQRPVHLNGSWERRTYLRVHEGDRVASPDVARRMLADAHPDRDSATLEGYTSADLDPDSVRRYRNILGSKRSDHPFLAEDERGFLRQIGAVKPLRDKGTECLTLGGLVMLGREAAIRERYPHWHLSYRELPVDISSEVRWIDRVVSDGTWNANLFEFYSRIILKLYEGLKVPFALDGEFRQDETSAHKAVREALVNTLVHADYEGRGGIRLRRDPSGFEFINPGLLLVTSEQMWRGGVSEPRNPVVQRFFSLIQLGEREGSGGPTIRRAWSEQHWRAPDLFEDVENSELHLKLRQESLLPASSVAAVRAELGDAFDAQDELGRLALVTARAEAGVTHARLSGLTNAHTRDVTLKFQELLRKGLLVASGPTRTRLYILPVDVNSVSQSAKVQSSEQIPLTFEQSSEQSSQGSEESSEERRGWRPKADQLSAVLAFCTEWRTLPEIATALGREPSTVRTKYLKTLIERGLLDRRYPESPRHPHQAYRAVNADE